MNTSTILFAATTILAGFAFGLAMLWVAAEWLKADGETEKCEADVRASLQNGNVPAAREAASA